MSIEQRLKKLMEDGWNIQIECKSTSRVYEMSYKAIGHSVNKYHSVQKSGKLLKPSSFKAVGNTLEELLDNIENYLKNWSELE